MKHRTRLMGLLAALIAALAIAACAEPAEGTDYAPEIPVPEYERFDLPEASPALEDAAEAAPVEESAVGSATLMTVSSFDALEIGETREILNDAWRGVDVRRAEGFDGKLAAVKGVLTLDDVWIEGVPAQALPLTDWFDLAPGARIDCAAANNLGLSPSAVALNRGSRLTLVPARLDEAVPADKVKWRSSNKKIASVTGKGVVKAVKEGTAIITAQYDGETACCGVVVTDVKAPRKIKLKSSKATLALDETKPLEFTLTPASASASGVTWKSSKPAVALVDGSGRVTGVARDTATVTATLPNGKKATCKVTVSGSKPTGIRFKYHKVIMEPGETFDPPVIIAPSDAAKASLSFTSSDPDIAAVDAKGTVTAVAPGEATVTVAIAGSDSLRDALNVVVEEPKSESEQLAGLVIGINPGHQIKTISKGYPIAPGSSKKAKGVKTGASGRATRQNEYEVVLQIGLKLKRILEEHGATVVITRTTNDVMLTNIDRAEMLNAAGCDIALQLHNDSCSNHSKSGVSGFIRTTDDWVEQSRRMAECLCEGMSARTGFKNLGVKIENGFMSLNWSTTPSVLLEMGYLSNRSDDKKLATDETREQLAWGIYDGICKFFGR